VKETEAKVMTCKKFIHYVTVLSKTRA